MRRATNVIAASLMQSHIAADRVCLDHDRRHRRRIVLETESGESVLLDLPSATHLRQGDGLQLEDGTIIAVDALPEPLLEITTPDLATLVRIAWHLGNRHLPTQLLSERLRIREDHVLEELVRHLGGRTQKLFAPFDPESGAYDGLRFGSHHNHHHHGHHHHGHRHG